MSGIEILVGAKDIGGGCDTDVCDAVVVLAFVDVVGTCVGDLVYHVVIVYEGFVSFDVHLLVGIIN